MIENSLFFNGMFALDSLILVFYLIWLDSGCYNLGVQTDIVLGGGAAASPGKEKQSILPSPLPDE